MADEILAVEVDGKVSAMQAREEGELEEGEIELSDPPAELAAGNAQLHPLEQAWTFWFDNPAAKAKQTTWGSSLRPIHTFSSVEEFWGLYNNIHPPSKLSTGADFHCFKEKIEPVWEDPVCAGGGRWTITLPRAKVDVWWLYTILAMIGEQFEYGDDICGAVVSIRPRHTKIALWTKNAGNQEAQESIGRQWKEFLDYNETIGFVSHEHAKRHDKGAKDSYSV